MKLINNQEKKEKKEKDDKGQSTEIEQKDSCIRVNTAYLYYEEKKKHIVTKSLEAFI